MTALVGAIFSCVTLLTGAPGNDATRVDICAPGDVCGHFDPAETAPSGYATPAEVDCRAIATGSVTVSRGDRNLFSGVCGDQTMDLKYRVSRFAEGERPNGALVPQRARRPARPVTAVEGTSTLTGLPPDHGAMVSTSVPPVAIYAYVVVPRPSGFGAAMNRRAQQSAPQRVLEPPDRPPRS